MGQAHADQHIHITIEAGDTQSQELFDYNSQQNRIITNKIITNHSYIVHDGEDIFYEPENSLFQPIFSIKVDYQKIQLQSKINNQKALWKVLGPDQNYHLNVGGIIKIGKMKMRLKELIQLQQEQKQITEKDISMYEINGLQNSRSMELYCSELSDKDRSQGQRACRICFESNNKKQNPLVSLCKCLGSVKYVHYQCLKDWISNNSIKRQHNNTLFFSYPQTKCEICKHHYEPYFIHQKRKYLLLDLSKAPNPPYAILQEMQVDFDQQNKRFSILLIGLGEEEVTIGRNSNCNVVMKDISVSRNHCSLMYKNRHLLLKDNKSKFGTLVMVENEIQFNPKIGLSLQYESKLIKFKKQQALSCCCCPQRDNYILKMSQKSQMNMQLHENY